MTTTTSLSRDGTPGDDRVPTGGRHLTGGTDERPVAAASAEPTPTAAAPAPRAGAPHDQHHARRWLVLGVVAVAQLMVVLDATIVNIALPSAQRALGFADTDRQWVVTAYALAFGSLLLLGGKLGDLFGRKTTFVTGLVGFAVASALGGAAQSFGVLVGARVLQGVFGALLAPAALATLATTFTDPKERSKAFGIFGAVAGGGSAVGLVLGGVLTEWLSWRWCLYVNLLFAAVAVAGALALLHNPKDRVRPKLDLPGTLLASAGLFCLVFGFSHAATKGWTDAVTLGALALGVLLLVVFVLVQQRVAAPLLPLHIVLNRVRGTSYAAVGLSAIAIFAVFLFLTYYLQQVQGFSPIVTGLAFLPLTAGIVTASTSANIILLPRTGPRPLLPLGMTLGATGMFLFTRLTPTSSYAGGVLPSLVILGLGFGLIFAPSFTGGTFGVARQETGVASATLNTMQQVGGSIGTALLSTLAASATRSYARAHTGPGVQVLAAVHGYTTAFTVSGVIFVVGAVLTATLLPSGVLVAPQPAPAREPVPAQHEHEHEQVFVGRHVRRDPESAVS
jgi:EmrB/QacA subfamily drug resistance transporter